MSAILRASGVHFDVDRFLVDCTLPVCSIKRKGEPVLPSTQPNGRRYELSAINVPVSDASFADFPQQIAEATAFLRVEDEQIRRLCEWPGVEGVTLDFGIERREVAAQFDVLPPDLLKLAGLLGLAIEISQYPIRSEGSQN